MDLEDDELLIPLSALQHYLFCPRQCALIHVEQAWAENRFTAEGRVLHETVDRGGRDRRAGVRLARSVPLACRRLGLTGVADVVEFHGREDLPYPVEYKRGRPKAHRADEVQVCAQALCLEEMFGVPVPEGALFYGENRRRTVVAIDAGLRALTEATAASARAMIAAGRTPAPVFTAAACNTCSLLDLCRPQALARPPRIAGWLGRQLGD